ncbi:uncharacterized protein LOC106169858 [Lingula anatina]|uniref:Uncharacterized protein LOC106169858 n=1 Tax=Lingula anatina TaxID=7574 RepID=A0A1S3J3E8_LINAN|nr:uncharacterized protein LOC106169858 [Lingula anatina]|eukprot:XP_013404942.1 uncharacterized protein LOC106169858 [Lingula anatina]
MSDHEGEEKHKDSHDGEDKHETDAEKKRKEYFKEELRRLQKNLKEEKEKIKPPPIKEHSPFIFNTLGPYCGTSAASYLINGPEDTKLVSRSYATRATAIGLCDPWTALAMDQKPSPRVEPPEIKSLDELSASRKKEDKDRPKKEGSTRLPKFPAVEVDAKDMRDRKLLYSDVATLRQEIKDKYTTSAQKRVNEEYNRTKQDFFRMELDKMEEIHPNSRPIMRSAYFAYLQNTPGAKKAVKECIKEMDAKMTGSSQQSTPREEKEEERSEVRDEQEEPRETPHPQPEEPATAVEASE